MEFNGKLAVITGGSSGIGLALAQALRAAGASVCLVARDAQKLEAARQSLVTQIPGSAAVHTLSADVSQADQIIPALRAFCAEVGAPDILVNNAGISMPGEFAHQPVEVFHQLMEINYYGAVHATHALLPAMQSRGSGYIVNVSSLAGFLGAYGYSAYGASKYALRGFSDVLRAELKPLGIKVSVVFPPDTDTPQLAAEMPHKPAITKELSKSASIMTPQAVAASILKGMRRGEYIITPGFESSFFFWLANFLGRLTYPVMDFIIADARKKAAKNRS